jgi:hypothetical protein
MIITELAQQIVLQDPFWIQVGMTIRDPLHDCQWVYLGAMDVPSRALRFSSLDPVQGTQDRVYRVGLSGNSESVDRAWHAGPDTQHLPTVNALLGSGTVSRGDYWTATIEGVSGRGVTRTHAILKAYLDSHKKDS